MWQSFDHADRLLEDWAGWRLTHELYEGTGNSTVARLLNPAHQTTPGSRVLWSGRMNSRLSALNKALVERLGVQYTTVTVSLYGMRGTDREKAPLLGLSCSTLARLRKRARLVACQYLEKKKQERNQKTSIYQMAVA